MPPMNEPGARPDRDRGPHILHLIPADGIGGVEVAARSMIAREDLPCRFRLQFIEPAAPAGRTLGSAMRVLAAHWRALRPARLFEPDVIVCSLWRSVPLALAVRAVRRQARLVYFIHLDTPIHRFDRLLSGLAMRAADAIWADSAATLAARGVTRPRGQVISMVTERVEEVDKAFVGPRFVSWGRLDRQKGFDRAIRFIASLVERGIDARYDLYGPDDGERDALLELVERCRLVGRVRLMGPVARTELPAIAARNAFYLQLSRAEGMCMAAVEAMQHGLVPIATAVGEMARYVVPDRTGIVVDPAQTDAALEAVRALIDTPEEWRRRSVAAMRYWRDAPVYAEDVCRTAIELWSRR